MQTNKPALDFSFIKSINQITKTDWNNLFGQGLIEGYGYQKTLEEANLKEFSFGYLLGKRGEALAAILPFFIMDFSFDLLIQGPLRKLAGKLKRFFTMRILFLGTPTTEEFYLGLLKDENLRDFFDQALEKLNAFCKAQKNNGLAFNNISEKNSALLEYLKNKNLILLETLPTTLIEIKAKSLEEYKNSLSKSMRKDLERKLKKSTNQVQLVTKIYDDISGFGKRIHELYMHNFDDSGVHFEILTPDFFENICRNMPGVAKYFITYDKDKIVAFNLCLVKNDFLIDKFVGFDKELARKYHLYFTTFCHNIDWCIKNNIKFYQPGTTDYYPKIRLGAKLIPLYIYGKAFNPFLNFCVKAAARFIEPKNLDPVLKEQ